MVTENGRAELRGLYTDPAQPLTIAVGQAFDLVSMPAAVGHAALTALRARRVRLGPVVADSRKGGIGPVKSVMRVGFLVAPANAPEAETGPRTPPDGSDGWPGIGRAEMVVGQARTGIGVGHARLGVGFGHAGTGVGVGCPGTEVGHAESAALREWASRLGGALGVRVGGRGSTATLPPLLPWRGWLHWLVPPGGAAVLWTPAGALLSVLSERSGARTLEEA